MQNSDNRQMPIPRDRAPGRSVLGITLQVLRVFWKTLWSIVFIGLLTGIVVAIAMVAYLFSISDSKIDYNLNSLLDDVSQTSYVYTQDAEGTWVESAQLHGVENREWVDYDKIPQTLVNAYIAIEDKRFKEHHGVDWNRTIYAIVNLFTGSGSSKAGGSTITQQLIKNVTQNDDVSISRKLHEIFQALNLEKEYSKNQIMESYLNLINLGNGCYGVQAAAQSYFGKDVSELTLLECASLAGITKNPAMYNPVYYPKNNESRRAQVLYEMYSQGMISQSEYLKCRNSELKINYQAVQKSSAVAVMDWYTEMVFNDVVADLMETYNLSNRLATEKIYREGLKIYSAVDTKLQSICEKYYIDKADALLPFADLQSGIIAMDYQGRILATVGRRYAKESNLLYSFAVSAQRQPGSSIKPLSVYSPAIEYNLMNWSSIIDDNPITIVDAITGKESEYPRNSYNSFRGEITLQKALEISSNCCAVRTVKQIGLQRSFDFITQRYHFTSLYEKYGSGKNTQSDVTLSALGTGGTVIGVTGLEMTAAYAAFGNGGKYYEPYSYYYVLNNDGEVVLDNRDKAEKYEQAISEDTASIMNKLLQAIVTGSEGTAKYARIPGWECFGKTGTTNDFKDRWFLGGNPYCIAAVWAGYEQPKKINGSHYSVLIWQEIMAEYLKGKEKKTFEMSDSIVELTYCTETGCEPSDKCEHTAKGWYKKGTKLMPCTDCANPKPDEDTSSAESRPEDEEHPTESKPVSKPESKTEDQGDEERENPDIVDRLRDLLNID